ncbi:DUF3658 domain-containing protein [Nocardia sp. NPDC052566]|uniref:DUF3658 domain-containing protein n=1 Tax=Nocardia sp. NPDC052566 TaxID=3364330 RepID=UPI0037C73F5D
METLHLVAPDSAAGSLRVALGAACGDSVAPFLDDLSCGPLEPDSPETRIQWWKECIVADADGEAFGRATELPREYSKFWAKVDAAEQLVVWYGNRSALDVAFFHAVADRLGDRPFSLIQVSDQVGTLMPEKMRSLLADARPITDAERTTTRSRWQRLKRENATFRVVTPSGLESAPADHYDAALLEATGTEWTPMARAIGEVMAKTPIGDAVLQWRVVSLVESGALVVDGDPRQMRGAKIKRP